jgi:lysyl endopeptidase
MRNLIAPLGAAVLLCLAAASDARAARDDGAMFMAGDALVLPTPALEKIVAEDGKTVGGPFRYGVQIPVDGMRLGAKGFGQWSRTEDGQQRWTFELVSPAAKSLDFHFSTLRLPEGAVLTIRGSEKVNGNVRSISAADLDGGQYWSPYVAGERAVLEITVPKNKRREVQLELASVTHGYRGLFETAGTDQKSGSCNIDVACSTGNGWHDQMSSVGQYTFSKSGSSYVCTGTLLANTAVNTTPYFLTANHCISDATTASSVVVYWNYQGANCRAAGSSASGTALAKSIATHSQSGSTLRATYAPSDMTLLQLSSNVPSAASPFWSGWSRSTTAATSSRGIHHPAGHEKRISVDNHALTITGYNGAAGSTHWRVGNWEAGTTEGGSSGSGLWDQNKRLIGQLHGGAAACGNTQPDWYGRLSVSWTGGGTNATRLSNWLDPGATGATTRDGYRAAGFFQNVADYTINDNATVESPISVSGRSGNAPTALRVNVRIMHTYIGDLKVDLVAPNGSVFTVHNRTGGTADNIYQSFTVNASASLANGTWKLRVNDNASGDTGFIDAWSLQF